MKLPCSNGYNFVKSLQNTSNPLQYYKNNLLISFRYVYVKTEQLGNQTGVLNGSCITYVVISSGMLLCVIHWACIWYFIPSIRFRFYQSCKWPNGTYIQDFEKTGDIFRWHEKWYIYIYIYKHLVIDNIYVN